MIEFNLKDAKAGKPVVTRDGHEARIVCFDRKDIIKRGVILALINNRNNAWERPVFYNNEGRQVDFVSSLDLMMKE